MSPYERCVSAAVTVAIIAFLVIGVWAINAVSSISSDIQDFCAAKGGEVIYSARGIECVKIEKVLLP